MAEKDKEENDTEVTKDANDTTDEKLQIASHDKAQGLGERNSSDPKD